MKQKVCVKKPRFKSDTPAAGNAAMAVARHWLECPRSIMHCLRISLRRTWPRADTLRYTYLATSWSRTNGRPRTLTATAKGKSMRRGLAWIRHGSLKTEPEPLQMCGRALCSMTHCLRLLSGWSWVDRLTKYWERYSLTRQLHVRLWMRTSSPRTASMKQKSIQKSLDWIGHPYVKRAGSR